MSISNNSPELNAALANINSKFRQRIIDTYLELKRRYSKTFFEKEYDAAGLSAGKFCETLLRFLQDSLTGTHIPFAMHIPNFAKEVEKIETTPKTSGNDSIRIIIPRALLLIYTLRNKRGIGHVGGDIEANGIDSSTIVRNADWIICELIRIYHALSIEEAQAIVDTIVSRSIPDIWEINGKKRILKKGISYKDQVLMLTYTNIEGGVPIEDLHNWVEYSGSLSSFKSSVLTPLHMEKLIEFDKEINFIYISPTGVQKTETRLLTTVV